MFKETLKELVEGTEGGLAGLLMDSSGIALESYAKDDSPFDIKAAHNGGFAGWCVTTGTHDAAQLRAAGAEAVFSDLFTLAAALDRTGAPA